MKGLIEYHGRLCRADGRPANPGSYHLKFSLHVTLEDEVSLWEEVQRGIHVASGGFFHVQLGREESLAADLFQKQPRFLAIRIVRGGRTSEETGRRVPIMATDFLNQAAIDEHEQRLRRLEERLQEGGALPLEPEEDETRLRDDLDELLDRVDALGHRVQVLESRDESPQIGELEQRLSVLTELNERLEWTEDEIEDLVGPDGDLFDIAERCERLEGALGLKEESTSNRLQSLEALVARLQADLDDARAAIAELKSSRGVPS